MSKARTVKTYYNGASKPASSTCVKSAVKAAFRRIVDRDYRYAQIFDAGKPVAIVMRRHSTIAMWKP